MIAYASRALSRSEENYCTTRKELLAVVYFLKYFKQYLLGRKFVVRTDHAPLTWLRKTPDPIGQQARWLEQLEEFDFEVMHRPGAKHNNADALSRRPCRNKCCKLKGVRTLNPKWVYIYKVFDSSDLRWRGRNVLRWYVLYTGVSNL